MNSPFGLYLIVTEPVAGYEAVAQAAVDCGLRYLQLRMKDAPRESVLRTARMFRAITQGTPTRFIVNDDLSIAIEAEADGLHLGQSDGSIIQAKKQWNIPGKIFGLSTHSLEQAQAAMDADPDYIGIGPVYPTRTKADADPALGPETVGRIASRIPVPSVAIGGITADNLPALLQAGIRNFCVVGAVNNHPDPAAAIHTLQTIWKNQVF